MKKMIIKIAAAALLIGGLSFNFVLSNANGKVINTDLASLTQSSVAFGESSWGNYNWDTEIRDCILNGNGARCYII